MVVLDRQKLRALPQQDFLRLCKALSVEWVAKGCPDQDHMPVRMLAQWVALEEETRRRGVQLRLFEDYDYGVASK